MSGKPMKNMVYNIPMKLSSVTCNKCGAPLSVPDDVNYLTCAFCGSSLQVVSYEGAVYTQVLASIERNSVTTVEELRHIRANSDVARLDTEWAKVKDGWDTKLSDMRANILLVTTRRDLMLKKGNGFGSIILSLQLRRMRKTLSLLSTEFSEQERIYKEDREAIV